MKKEHTLWLIAGAFVGVSALSAFAHGGATGIVKERMDGMAIMGGAVKTISKMFRAGDYDSEVVKTGADAILKHSGEQLLSLFSQGAGGGSSEAKSEIWTDWDGFTNLAEQLDVYATAFKASADTPPSEKSASGGMMSSGMGTSVMGTSTDKMMPTAEMLAEMSSDKLFDMVVRTCASCHTKYRIEN